jgi:hypothetical protein
MQSGDKFAPSPGSCAHLPSPRIMPVVVLDHHRVSRCGNDAWLRLQLAMKFLEKDELSNYTFQNDFMRPFVVVMRQSQVGWECTILTARRHVYTRRRYSSNMAKHGLQRLCP